MTLAHTSTVAENEPAWETVKTADLPREAFAHQGNPRDRKTWGFPHHWVRGGEMFLHAGALKTVWESLHKGRAAPEVVAHLRGHAEAIGLEEPPRNGEPWEDGQGLFSRRDGDALELYVYDEISPWGIDALQVAKALGEADDAKTVRVFLNSPGGLVYDSVAIYNLLRRHPARIETHADGIAASGASILFMAGDRRVVSQGALLMIHGSMGMAFGNAADMRQMTGILETIDKSIVGIYAARTGAKPQDLAAMMEAETWLDAEAAVKAGFAHEVAADGEKAVAAFDLSIYAKAPEKLKGTGRAFKLARYLGIAAHMNEGVWLSGRQPDLETTPGAAPGTNVLPHHKEPDMSQPTQTDEERAAAEAKAKAEAEAKAKADAEHAAEAAKAAAEAKAKADAEAQARAKTATEEEVKKAAADATARAKTIVGLCQMAHHPEMAAELVGLSVEDARQKLFETVCAERKPVGDGGGTDGQLTGDPNARFKAEYAKHGGQAKLNCTLDEYVRTRRIDEGLDKL